MRQITVLLVAMGVLWSTAALGAPALTYVYDASASSANNSIQLMGVKVFDGGEVESDVETLSKGYYGQSPYSHNSLHGAMGTETAGGLAPASWSYDTIPWDATDLIGNGWEVISTGSGLIGVGNSMNKTTTDPSRSNLEIDWKIGATWSSSVLGVGRIVRRDSNYAVTTYTQLGNGNLGVGYMENGTSNTWYREAALSGGAYAWTGSEINIATNTGSWRGQDSLTDTVNGRFRLITPQGLGGGGIYAIKSDGTVDAQTLASITGLTPTEYYRTLSAVVDTTTGNYLVVGHDSNDSTPTAGTGEVHLADIVFNEGGSSTATEYYIAGDASAGKWITDSVVGYDPNNDFVVVAYLEGGYTTPTANDLYVRVAERVGGALVFGSPILVTNDAGRSMVGHGGGYRPMAMEVVVDGSDTYLYFAYGTWDAGISTAFGADDIHVAKYALIPEPATLSVLALGGLALLLRRRR